MNQALAPGLPQPVAVMVADAKLRRRQVEELVRGVVRQAFSRSPMPRSPEYMAGVEAWLLFRALDSKLIFPYAQGSAQLDAWLAGLEEGKGWWHHQLAHHFPGR